VDHRGHGRSTRRPASEWTLDTWADDIVRLCDALGIVKPIVLGQSFGGFVAQRYIARHPTHARKVILSSTAPALNLHRKLAVFERLGGTRARELAQAFWTHPCAETWAPYNVVCKPLYNTQPPADPQAGERVIAVEDILFTSASGEQQTMDLLPGLAAAQCPVLVMVGEEDPVTPVQDSLDIAAALPPRWVQLERFAGCGHGVWRDDADAGMAVLRRFVSA
jgi:pimeloyl-ACP methyl ester carboxylesterase